MLESALVLHKHYGADLAALQLHITDLLYRFTNAALKDTCQRVGGDPVRKLSPDDRLIGSARLAVEHGITPAYIAVGIAAGIRRYLAESNLEQTAEFAEATLIEISHLDPKAPLCQMVLNYYEMINTGCTLQELLAKADQLKHVGMDAVV
jgi:mannitol-1-phosphate 5-dehydrogenase